MRIRLLGDTHGKIETIVSGDFCDYTVVLGDFGVVGRNLVELNSFLEENNKILLFVDGNHENYNKLRKSKTKNMFGGEVGIYARNIFWLKRGEIYTFNNKKILTFGGALSIDRHYRQENIDWFPDEQYSKEEYLNLYSNLEKHNNTIDYILTHDCPKHITRYIHGRDSYANKTTDLLENIYDTCIFDKWFFGHHHKDIKIGNSLCLWEKDFILKNQCF